MHRVLKILFISYICLLSSAKQTATAQATKRDNIQFTYNVDNFNFFDNREVHSPYQRSQTLFGSRLEVEAGLQFDANTIMVGAMGVKDFGKKGIAQKDLTLYYCYEEEHLSGAFGAFPRSHLKQELPDIFIYDSLRYYSPILHGALIQYTSSYGYAEFYCNWINKQGVNEREIFELVTDGRFGHKGYYFGWNAQLTHFSVPQPHNGLHVYDKLMIHPHVGIEKSQLCWADAFSIDMADAFTKSRPKGYAMEIPHGISWRD